MPNYYMPDERDKQTLIWVIAQIKKMFRNGPIALDEVRVPQSSDCFVAKLPDAGIPARSGDVPGYANCDIYRIDDDSSSYVLSPADFDQLVFNISDFAAIGNYVPIILDRYGRWLVNFSSSSEEAGTGTCIGGIDGVTWGEMEIVDPTAVDPDDPGHLLYVDPITGCLKLFPIFPCN